MAIAKKKKDIKISFVDSPSSEDVTGSLIFISTPNHKILVDAGLHQTNDKYQDFLVNNRKYKEFKPKEIDYIFVTHVHGDHCLLIPKLFKEGCKARVILTAESAAVIKDMSMDCAEINQRDVLIINSQNNKNYSPLYIEEDVEKMMCNIDVQPVNKKIIIDNTLSYELIPAGHLLGSSQVLLHFDIDNVQKSILITGDIGNKLVGNRFVGEYQQVKSADVVIAESTYGDKPNVKTGKKERRNDINKFKSIIDTQIKDMNGRVIIPSFAQSRIQQLALMVYQMYKDSDWKPVTYIDSPLSIQIFKDYQQCLSGQDKKDFDEMIESGFLTLVKESEDSKALVSSKESCLILSTSGMCQVGRIRHHLKRCIPDPNATCLFVGFCTDGSLGALLKDNKRNVITIDQKDYPCRCAVYNLKSMSGHAPFNQLIENYTEINCSKIILHHGSKKAKEVLKSALEKEFEKKCKSTRVVIANSSLKFNI